MDGTAKIPIVRVKLQRLKYHHIFEPIFEMVGVDVFRDWLLDLWIHWSSEYRVSKLLQISWHVGRTNTQVWLLNSLVRLTGWVNSELVGSMRNTERMMFNSVHNVETPSEMSYLLFIYFPCQNRWMVECSLPESQELCLEITVLALVDRRISVWKIKIASAVNQICRFAATKSSRNHTVGCRRHPTE